MRIAVIGHLCQDIIHLPDNTGSERVTESYGGIFWTLATVANLLSPSDDVCPVFGVGEADYDPLVERIGSYRNVDTSGIFKFKGRTNQVHLFYGEDAQHRIECSRHISEPIPFDRIKPYLDVDGVLVNMISGYDITLDTLDHIRMSVRDKQIPIHFDFHSLTLGIDKEFKRFRRPVTDWRRWCFMMNSIQMSEDEAAGLTSERFDEPALVNHLLSLMVNGLIVTRDRRGGTLFRQQHKKIVRHDYTGIRTKSVDPTGCGDVFGSAFLVDYLKSLDWIHAVEFANQAAAAKATFAGVDGVDRIQDLIVSTSA